MDGCRYWGRVRVAAACALVTLLAWPLFGCGMDQGGPVSDLLVERGIYEPTDGWEAVLSIEQKAAVDKAYDASVQSGYQGTKEEWLERQVRYCKKDDGRVALVLPDGYEFDVDPDELFSQHTDVQAEGETETEAEAGAGAGGKTQGNEEPAEETPAKEVPLEDWYGDLEDDQIAAIDIAFEQSVSDGYQGTRDDWLKTEVEAHYNHVGDVRVELPDGGEFVVPSKAANTSKDGARKGGGSRPASVDGQGASISAGTVRARPGQTGVAVEVAIEHNPGVLGLALSASYDNEAMTLKSAENGDAFKDVLTMTRSKGYESGCVFAWDGVEVKGDDVRDGTILTLYFDVSADAKGGTYPIEVVCEGSAVDNDLKEVPVSVQSGSVVVG